MEPINELLGQTDIYLIDQIMKGRYAASGPVLDAGAGAGRNLHWFVQSGVQVYAADRDPQAVDLLKQNYPGLPPGHFVLAPLESLPFPDAFFHHVLCSAVLHFATHEDHFRKMFEELSRVLRPGGSMFLRVATDRGLAEKMVPLGNGRFRMPDGTDRYLLTRTLLEDLMRQQGLHYLEPFKTVLVDELRSMTALVLGKAV